MYKIKKTILVTGGCGFIGSHLVLHLVKKYPEYRIINYDKLTYAANIDNLKEIENEYNYVFVNGDICDYQELERQFLVWGITDVIHLAAESHVDNSITGPILFEETNVRGTLNLLEVARNFWNKTGGLKGHRFHHVSTDEVYGMLPLEGNEKFTENTKYDPHSPYSASKAASDHFVKAYHSTYGMETTISNCSNNYGSNQHREKLIPTVIDCINNKKNIPIYGEGKNVRDWLYVEDHVSAIDLIFHNGVPGETYNVGGNNEKTNIELIDKIIEIYWEQNKGKYNSIDEIYALKTFVTDRKGHDLRYAIDSTKIQKELGWKPQTNFEEGIRKTIKFYMT